MKRGKRSLRVLVVILLAGLVSGAGAQVGPVVWYSFEELTGGQVVDRSGRGLHMRVMGMAALAPGKVGQAVALDGQGYLQTPDAAALDLTEEITLEAWVYPTAVLGGGGRIIDKSTPARHDGYLLDTYPDNHTRMIAMAGVLRAPRELPLNEWTHVVAVLSSYDWYQRIYYNGELVAENPGVGGGMTANDNPLTIGADPQGGNRFQGRLDEVRVYPWALTEEQVAARARGEEVSGQIRLSLQEELRARPIALRGHAAEIDYEALVGHYDVVYRTPTVYPFEAMPVGNGNLGVMVGNQGGMQWQLNNGDFWLQRAFAQVTSGVVRLEDEPRFVEAPEEFEQRLELYNAAVVTRAQTGEGEVVVTTFVAEGEDLVVVRVEDGRQGPVRRELSIAPPREGSRGIAEGDTVAMVSASGFPEEHSLASTAVLMAQVEGLEARAEQREDGQVVLRLGEQGPVEYTIWLAAPAVRPGQGDPVEYARARLREARERGGEALGAEQQRFWHEFWTRSALYLTSRDGTADYMANLWHLNLYWAGAQSRGEHCPKFNGGNFLLDGDNRGWGGSYWYQNTREMFWALLPANQTELMQPLLDLYWRTLPEHQRHARELFGVGGAQVQETMTVLGEGDKRGNPYTFLYLTTGLEVAHQFYSYYEFTRDEEFLRERAYPLLKEMVQFYLEWARREEDGKWHLYPCNGRETYWRVKNSHVDLVGLRKCLPILLSESERLGRDEDRREQWAEFLENLAELPMDEETGGYAPCVFLQEHPDTGNELIERLYPRDNTSYSKAERKNAENVECDILYPWGLAGIDTPNRELAEAAYRHRPISSPGNGWDPSAIWAARLGLAEEAVRMLVAHANANQVWPQGFWNSPAGIKWANTLVESPYFDSPGVNATALAEMALQSYDGRLRLWPAAPDTWAGLFRLRAMPGFMVTSEMAGGQVRYAVIESLRGGPCTVISPWEGGLAVKGSDGMSLQGGGGPAGLTVTFPTQAGETYLVTAPGTPVEGFEFAALRPERNEGPRWPGRREADQEWQPGQRIMLGLMASGHPLRVKMEAEE